MDATRIVGGQYLPAVGTWKIDPGHTSVAFAIRHLMTRMRGRFRTFDGEIEIAEDPQASSIRGSIEVDSIDTAFPAADEALCGDRFLDTQQFPAIDFASHSMRWVGNAWRVEGTITIKGIERPVQLDARFLGAVTNPLSPDGQVKAGFEASGVIAREDFGIGGAMPACSDAPAVRVMGSEIELELDIEAEWISRASRA